MSEIDVRTAKELFDLLQEPLLLVEERIIRQESPALDAETVLDSALRTAIAHTHLTVNGETFEYLRWKVTIARASARASTDELHVARADRALARQQRARTFRDGAGMRWTVSESSWRVAGGEEIPCLVFSSPTAVRRVKNIPDDWGSLSDAELSTLSWSR